VRVSRWGRAATVSRIARRAGVGLAALCAVWTAGTTATQDAIANGDTRSLTLYHNHTKERATITFRRNGRYDSRGLEQLNWFLRDWRRDEPTKMDPRLFDTLWEVYRQVGSNEAIHVASAYRSPHTNAMLRRRSGAVAKNSQHMLGKAMDFYLPDVPIDRIRAVGMRLQHGGVGYYPSSYTPFVHLDVGSVRAWPRMSRDQLVRLFPDGKTVHIPADGKPLPGYEVARAEVLSQGWSVAGYSMVADAEEATPAAPARKSFWATLFGGGDDDEDAEEIRASRSRQAYVPRRAPPVNVYSDRSSSVYAALEPAPAPAPVERQPARVAPESAPVVARREPAPAAPAPVAPVQEIPAPAPRTRIAGLPNTVQTPAGPKLVWNQGAAGQDEDVPVKVGADSARDMAFAPLPPRRPEDVVVTGALAFAPMPPTRPGSLAATNPIPLPGGPELRGTSVAALPSVEHPMPPPRPAAAPVVVASLGVAATASVAPLPIAAAARQALPQPQLRPAAPAPVPARTKAAPVSSGSLVTAAGTGLKLGFSTNPMSDLSPNRFTGPAVKPLPVIR
jgi:uncharacterized protein YcbK (DUF882 family)